MANTRKPAKGQAPKGAKTFEDAVVVHEKGIVKTTLANDKSAKKSGKRAAPSTSEKQAEGTSKAVVSAKEVDAKPLKKKREAETGSDKPAPKEDTAAIKKPTSDGVEKPKTSTSQSVATLEAPRRGVFVPMILGGAIAATLSFWAARYPDQWPFVSSEEDTVAAELSTLRARLYTLEEQSAAQDQALAALQADESLVNARGEITGEFAELRKQLEAMSTTMSDVENRLHTIGKLSQGSGMEATTVYERELQQMREMLDQELAKISSSKASDARAALFDLTEQASVDAPAALVAYADTGVVTLSALQAAFPSAAREAINASVRAAMAAGETGRVSAFMRLQLGTRSLEPKEGTDADAILSRAEGALKAGQIDAALTELNTLPDAGKKALEGWISDATARKDALAAGDALSQPVNKK